MCAFGVPSLNVTCLGAAERYLSQQDALRMFHIAAFNFLQQPMTCAKLFQDHMKGNPLSRCVLPLSMQIPHALIPRRWEDYSEDAVQWSQYKPGLLVEEEKFQIEENALEYKLIVKLKFLVECEECLFPHTADFRENVSSFSHFFAWKRMNGSWSPVSYHLVRS